MLTFIGEYHLALDAKGRLSLPAGFRKQLPDTDAQQFVIKRGFEGCLEFYLLDAWKKVLEDLNKLNGLLPEVREYQRKYTSGATLVDMDSAGRTLIPKNLTEPAGITKEVVFIARGNMMEIWDKAKYEDYMNRDDQSLSDLAAKIGGSGFMNPFI